MLGQQSRAGPDPNRDGRRHATDRGVEVKWVKHNQSVPTGRGRSVAFPNTRVGAREEAGSLRQRPRRFSELSKVSQTGRESVAEVFR